MQLIGVDALLSEGVVKFIKGLGSLVKQVASDQYAQTKFVLELLMYPLACPAGLNRAYQRPARRVRRVLAQ